VEALGTVGVAVVAFTSTNLDDLVLLAAWFANRRMGAVDVVLGQFVGIGALIALSVAGAMAAVLVPYGWLRWLGLLPVAIGVRSLRMSDQSDGAAARGAGAISVAAVTFANGGDNVGVYVPLFASLGQWRTAVVVVTFLVMTAVWCAAGFLLVRNPLFGHRVAAVGARVTHWVLVAIGVFILFGEHLSELL
jgi:cadmium resistance protein CadD (predicted permease)